MIRETSFLFDTPRYFNGYKLTISYVYYYVSKSIYIGCLSDDDSDEDYDYGR